MSFTPGCIPLPWLDPFTASVTDVRQASACALFGTLSAIYIDYEHAGQPAARRMRVDVLAELARRGLV